MKLKTYILLLLLPFANVTEAQKYSPAEEKINRLIDSAYSEKENSEALKTAAYAYKMAEKIHFKVGMMEALNCTCSLYLNIRNDKEAIETSDKIFAIAAEDNNYYYQNIALESKISAYTYLGFFNEAYKTAALSESIAKHLKGDQLNDVLGNLYHIKSEIENISGGSQLKVMEYNRRSIGYFEKIKDDAKRNNALPPQYYNLSFSMVATAKYDSAVYYARKGYDMAKANNNPKMKGQNAYGIATAYLKMKKMDSALYYYKKAEPFLLKPLDAYNLQYLYEDMAFIYSDFGDNEKYLYYSKKARDLQNATLDSERKNVNKVTVDLLQEEKKEWYQQFYVILAGILIIVSVIIFFTIKIFINYKKTKKLKAKTENNLLEKEEKVSQLELRVNDAFEEVMVLAKKNDPAFLSRFKEVYPEFYDKITTSYPELTLNQLRFCAMMKLNFSTKEIADYHHMSVRGVQIKKNRLRKQLEIPSDIDLNKWMMEL